MLDLFKLEKLKIESHRDHSRSGADKTFEVMYNPSSFSLKHENVYQGRQDINGEGKKEVFSYSRSSNLTLSLILDGTGVSDLGIESLGGLGVKSVAEQIEEFLDACFDMDGDIHEPKHLRLQWGEGPLQEFDCRLKSVDTQYTSFHRNGAPQRAELTCTFVEDKRRQEKRSPDLSHTRTVAAGDTLPQLCREIYGSPEHYLRVAQINRLDNFRHLIPGQELIFPPFEHGSKKAEGG